ncbi:hypothetical protein FACS1894190_01570 [Spirochaetia bacterium]|nr:hypothetical protein FACS1894190_01570 [Spirochaetia bacterium]
MKIVFISVFLLSLSNFAFAEDSVVLPKNDPDAHHGISLKVNLESKVKSIFNDGQVIDVSTDPLNKRNFGVFVETLTKISYMYKSVVITEEIYVVYSNLSKIYVEKGQSVTAGTVIGNGGGIGTNIYPTSNDVFIFIFTKEHSPFLNGKTGNNYFEDKVFWWDPSFLF